jgi:hypothetical protein
MGGGENVKASMPALTPNGRAALAVGGASAGFLTLMSVGEAQLTAAAQAA